MSWQYRIVKSTNKDCFDNEIVTYGFHQVYIDENEAVVRIEDHPVPIFSDSLKNLAKQVEQLKAALNLFVIDFETGSEISL